MARKVLFIALSFFLLSISFVSAEEQKMTPEQQQQMVQQQMLMMAPLFGQMMKIMMETQFEVLSQPGTAEKLATYAKNFYDELIKKGFSKEDALQIAMNVGIPSMPGMQK